MKKDTKAELEKQVIARDLAKHFANIFGLYNTRPVKYITTGSFYRIVAHKRFQSSQFNILKSLLRLNLN